MSPHLKISIENHVAVVTLDRPEALNALNLAMLEEFSQRLAEWEADDQVRMVLVRSAHPKAFCAGGDISSDAASGEGGRLCLRRQVLPG
jgi:enoyl-CoA hydratase